MENKDNNKKSLKVLKKEGIYVLLFVCLCVIAAVLAITTNNNKRTAANKARTAQNQKSVSKEIKENSLAENDKKINNAVQVKNDLNSKNKKTGVQVTKNKEKAVSKTSEVKFIKPVEGKIVMKYSQTPVWWETSKSYRPNFGINVKADVGVPVKVVADGTVKDIEQNGSFGTSVTIFHPESGKVTFYGNLDKHLDVKKGDKVTQGQTMGKIGKESLRGMTKEIGNKFLHFEVLKNSKGDPQFLSENPEKYIKY